MAKSPNFPKDKRGRDTEKKFFGTAGNKEKSWLQATGSPKKGKYHETRDVAIHNKVGRNVGHGKKK